MNQAPSEMMVSRSYLTLQGQGHVTLNPYHHNNYYANNYEEDLHDGLAATLHLRDSVYMSPQLLKLTNTLRSKKKVCQGAHPGNQQQQDSEEVVFRAVSPHGHVYWEIDPSRVDRLKQSNLDNIPNPGQDHVDPLYSGSRQSSSRYSDNHPLISGGSSADGSNPTVLVNPFADVQLISASMTSSPLHNVTGSPSPGQLRPELRFGSLRGFNQEQSQRRLTGQLPLKNFTNRSNSARNAKMRDIAKQIEHMRILQQQRQDSPATSGSTINTTTSGGPTTSGSSGSTSPTTATVPEQLQQQVQIRDLKPIPVSVASSDHILAKIQNVIGGVETNGAILNRASPKQRKV